LSVDDLRLVGATATLRGPDRSRPSSGSPGGSFLASASQRDERRADLVRRFGAPVGRLRGLDRFVTTDAGGRHEVLATVDTILPVEVSTAAPAGGSMLTTITYEPREGYGHLRRLVTTQHHLPGPGAGLALTEVELTNVVLSDEVRP
jgi:hypothetical protein